MLPIASAHTGPSPLPTYPAQVFPTPADRANQDGQPGLPPTSGFALHNIHAG